MATNKLAMMVRSFSTGNINQQLVKAPIQVFGIEGRYATALYSAASKQKTLDAVEKDLKKLHSSLKTDLKFQEFMVNPVIKRSIKAEALKTLGGKASLNQQTTNLLQTLAENGRLKKLNGVINAFKIIMSAHRGEITCEIVTAKALDATQKQKLESVLKSFLKSKETLSINTIVDPSIVGGMIVSIGDRYVDMSVASKIKKYTDIISAAV